LKEKEVGEGVKALTGAGEKEAQKPVVAVQAGAGEKRSQKPAAVEEVARPVSLPPEEPPQLEVGRGNGNGRLLFGLSFTLRAGSRPTVQSISGPTGGGEPRWSTEREELKPK